MVSIEEQVQILAERAGTVNDPRNQLALAIGLLALAIERNQKPPLLEPTPVKSGPITTPNRFFTPQVAVPVSTEPQAPHVHDLKKEPDGKTYCRTCGEKLE